MTGLSVRTVSIALPPLDVDDLFLFKENAYSSLHAYKNSKLANLMFTYELSRQLTGSGVTVNAVDPGMCIDQCKLQG